MKKTIWLIVIIVAVAVFALLYFGSAGQQPSTPTPTSTSAAYFSERTSTALGTYLTDPNGMTLYTFTHDTVGKSNCTGVCLTKWPPYGPGVSASGTLSVPLPANVGAIAGNNGMLQFTWKGMPLYYYVSDKTPGQTLGEGLMNAWYVVKQ